MKTVKWERKAAGATAATQPKAAMPRAPNTNFLLEGLASSFLAAGLAAAGFCGRQRRRWRGREGHFTGLDHRHVALYHVFEVDGDVAVLLLHISFIRFTRLVP